MFDEKLNQRAIDLLQGAPVAMFMVGYWALGNPQIFFNVPPTIKEHGSQAENTEHWPFNFNHVNSTQLMLLVIIYLWCDTLFMHKYRKEFFKWIKLVGDGTNMLKADIDEGLANYWQALTGIEQKIWYTNEIYNRANTGVVALSEEALEKIRT